MNCLSSDPDQPALLNWSMREQVAIDPMEKLPDSGELLVSSLSVLTPAQFCQMVEADVILTSVDGLDMRPWAPAGPFHKPLMKALATAVTKWLGGYVVPNPLEDTASLLAQERQETARLQALLADMGATLQEVRTENVRLMEAARVAQADVQLAQNLVSEREVVISSDGAGNMVIDGLGPATVVVAEPSRTVPPPAVSIDEELQDAAKEGEQAVVLTEVAYWKDEKPPEEAKELIPAKPKRSHKKKK